MLSQNNLVRQMETSQNCIRREIKYQNNQILCRVRKNILNR